MLSVHNCFMYLQLMTNIRTHIAAGTFAEFRREFITHYVPSKNLRVLRAAERG
jgi:queuine/archaeosine tRNA-ribosyltransferase